MSKQYLYKTIRLYGVVFSGLGVGGKYVEIYREVFFKYLGLNPYPGTLNIDFGFDTRKVLPLDKALIIPPPSDKYNYIYVFEAFLNNKIKVFVIKPQKTRYPWSVLEIISEYNLRKRLGLRNSDFVELVFMV